MMEDIFKDKIILVTGGTGSFGKAFVKKLLTSYKPAAIRVYSRDELKQWEMKQELESFPNVRFFIGDVRDEQRLTRASEGVDFLVHAAALKQVPACEYNPIEAVKTNVEGAINVVNAALNNNVKKVIALSTDKAANPINIYGATKLCSDKVFIQSNSYRGKSRDSMFSVVRYGNVIGSRGSVIPLFNKQKESGEITITDENMTRFWITLPQAVDFVISNFKIMQGGELFVPKLFSVKITDLAKTIAPDASIKKIGIRPGEKIHEWLITQEDSFNTYELTDRYIIFSHSPEGWEYDLSKYPSSKKVSAGFEYNSRENEYMSESDLRNLLIRENLLK